MANKIVSIEVGIWRTKVCVTSGQKKNPHIYQAFAFSTPENVIEDGYIRDKESFAKYLNNELQKHGVKDRNVIFTFSSSKIITREISIPQVKEDKIANIVQAQAKDYFPMDISNYSITYTKMDAVEEDGKKLQKLMLIAVPDNLLNNYYSFAEMAGLHVESFDYIGNSTVQFMSGKIPAFGGIVVELDEQTTIISILSDGKLVFQRITPYGYMTTLSNIMNHKILGIKDEYDAFEFLRNNNVIHYDPQIDEFPNDVVDDPDRKKELLEEAYADIRESLSYHIRVVYTAVEYYQNQMKGSFKGNLHLVGRGAKIAGLEKMFEQEIPLQMAKMDYHSAMNWAKTADEKNIDATEFISTVGAVIHPIDIKPKEMKERESRKSGLKSAYLILGLSTLTAVVLVLVSSLRYLGAVSEQHNIAQGIDNLSYIEDVYDLNRNVKLEYQVLSEFEQRTISNNDYLGELIEQLEQQLPTNMTVESLSVNEANISLNVTCDVKMTAAAFLVHMQNISMLTNVTIPSMAESEDAAGNKVWRFSVLADYVGVGVTTSGDAAVNATTSGDAVVNE